MTGRTQQRGIALVMSYLLIALATAYGSAMMVQSLTEHRVVQRHLRLGSAFQLAEAGLDRGIWWLATQPIPPSVTAPFDPFGGPQPLGRGTYTVTIDPDDNNPFSYSDLFLVTVVGRTTDGIEVTREVSGLLRNESFSRYSFFTDSNTFEDGLLWFINGDHLQGPVHTNGQFNIMGSPIFDGPVSSVDEAINYFDPPPPGGNDPQFNGGLTLGVSSVEMPSSATALRVAASSGGQWYEGNTTLVMRTGGCGSISPPCLRVTNAALSFVNKPRPLPGNGAVFVNAGNATVSGTLDGQLTIGTSQDLRIPGNLVYADNPQENSSSNDVCGLVAEGNVVVTTTAPHDLTIQASIMALNTSFSVEHWWDGPPRGTLSVYGGLIQKNRGPVGSIDGETGLRMSGYAKDYRYDTRLSNLTPVAFPTTGGYQVVMWQENP